MSGSGNEIVLLVEGQTEAAVKGVLKNFLDTCCEKEGKPKVRLSTKKLDSRLLKEKTVRDQVTMNLRRPGVLGVVALIDVLVSGHHFKNAAEAIAFLKKAAPNEPRYRAHAAQHDFEAWLLPYWDAIAAKVNVKKKAPAANPEAVNHNHPPSWHLKELFRTADRKLDYHKPRDAKAILTGKDLLVSANTCPQFKAFLNSLLDLADCGKLE